MTLNSTAQQGRPKMLNFTISEFLIDRENPNVPVHVVDELVRHHIPVIQKVRDKLGFPIWPSQRSGYRSVEWEHANGRSGNSEHCFKGKGAVDYTCKHPGQLKLLFHELKKSPYLRVCYYPGKQFIHCDYKGSERVSFICSDGVNWIRE